MQYLPDDPEAIQDFTFEVNEISDEFITVQINFEEPLNVSSSDSFDKIALEIDKVKFGQSFQTWYGEPLKLPIREFKIQAVVPSQHPIEGKLKEQFET